MPPAARNLIDPAAAIGVATGNNRINSQGRPPDNLRAKTSQIINNIVQPGTTLPVPAAGTQFYLLVATLPIEIRPSGGVFNMYSAGKGLNLLPQNAFELLEVRNTSAVAVVFSIFVGFDGYIDNTLILNTASGEAQVVFPTYPVENADNDISILDLSGSVIADPNGDEWYAISRTAILLFNADTAAVYSVVNMANNKTVALLQPVQALRLDFSGDYRIVEGGNINAIVSEIYQAIPKTIS